MGSDPRYNHGHERKEVWSETGQPKVENWRMGASIPLPPACEAGALPFELIPRNNILWLPWGSNPRPENRIRMLVPYRMYGKTCCLESNALDHSARESIFRRWAQIELFLLFIQLGFLGLGVRTHESAGGRVVSPWCAATTSRPKSASHVFFPKVLAPQKTRSDFLHFFLKKKW